MQSRSIDQTISADRFTASGQVRPASLKGRRTARRRAGRSRAGRSRKPIKRPDGWAPTTARRKRRSASPEAATRGRPGPRRHDRGAGRTRRERALSAMAQPLGRDPSRPFAVLAAHENPGLSHPGRDARRTRQRDAARPAPTEGSEARIIGLASFRNAGSDNAGRDQAEGRGSARPRMEWPAQACDDPRPGRRLERRDLRQPVASRQGDDRHKLERPSLLWLANGQVRAIRDGPSQVRRLRRRFVRCRLNTDQRRRSRFGPTTWPTGGVAMRSVRGKTILRCAVYTRVSTEHGLEQEFNSLDNQREASEAYVKSQAHEDWKLIRTHYDDGGYSGGSMDRPALQSLVDDVRARRIDVIVVYKVDRLTRSLADFAKLVELFDAHQVSFVSVTQAFNTTTSMGRLTLNVLLSFAQFERGVTGERIRDKIGASKRRGLWVGGMVPLGYVSRDKKLVVADEEAERVRTIFRRYLDLGSIGLLLGGLGGGVADTTNGV